MEKKTKRKKIRLFTMDGNHGDRGTKGSFGCMEVGDNVYYKAPQPTYAIRKSTVVEVIEYPFRRCGPVLPRYEYVLANGERLRWLDAYATREAAELALIEDLKSRLAFQKVSLANLQHEMAQEEEALHRLERCHAEGKQQE